MKRQSFVVLFTLMLLSGCASLPSISCTPLSIREVYLTSLAKNPHFAIITDGAMHGSAYNTSSRGVKYKGYIRASDNGTSIDYYAKGNNLYIDEHVYNLGDGRLILVSTRNDPFLIRQFKVSEDKKIQSLIVPDEYVCMFLSTISISDLH